MRTLRTIMVVPLAVLCVLFLVRFARIQYSLWQVRDGPGLYLVAEPQICVYRAFMHEHRERHGWTLFLLADVPEGTRPVFYFPTWPLAVASVGVLIYAGFAIFEWSDKRVA
jgi:hypothetical protein